MTDREFIIFLQAEINKHLESTCPPGPDDPEVIPPEKEGDPPKGDNWDGWLWPVPYWEDQDPAISDGFYRHQTPDHRQHLGVDIMFKNPTAQTPDLPEVTKWYHMPSKTVPMLAMGPGNIWFAGETSVGWTVQIDHHELVGFPLVTYYTHMSELFIPEWPSGGGGMEVHPGLELGFIGNNPSDNDPNHCHMEMWDYSNGPGDREQIALNPEHYLPYFGKLVLP